MTRLALAPILVIAAAFFFPTPKDLITAKYKQFNTAYMKSDRVAMGAWVKGNCIPKFTYTSYNKTRYSRDGFRDSVLQDMQNTVKVLSSSLTVRKVEKHGEQQVAVIASEFKGNVVIDTRRFVLSDKSVDTDTWIKDGKEWTLLKRVEQKDDMQLQPTD